MNRPGGGRSGRRPCLQLVALLVGTAAAALPAAAASAPLGSPALGRWLERTAAEALRASEPSNDLRVGGLLALNRGLGGGLDGIRDLGPKWLRAFDLDVSLRDDLSALYALSARRDVFTSKDGRQAVEIKSRLSYDEVGRSGGELALGMRSRLADEALALSVRGAVDREWLIDKERYTLGAGITWAPLSLSGVLYNDVRDDPALAPAIRSRTLDGYEVRVETRLPGLPWLRAAATHTWRGALNINGEDATSDHYGLQIRPFESLEVEAGTNVNSGLPEANWYTRLRYTLKFG